MGMSIQVTPVPAFPPGSLPRLSSFLRPGSFQNAGEADASGSAPLLIYRNLPPLIPSVNTSNSPELLRYFVANRLRTLMFINGKGDDKTFCQCCRVPRPSHGKKKNGDVYETGQPGHIQIHRYADSDDIAEVGEDAPRHGYVGLQKCASAMRCPSCGARIRYVRRQEVETIARQMIGAGYSVAFQTLTAPHNENTDPVKFVDNFQAAVRWMKQRKTWGEFVERWRIRHYIRSIEMTVDKPRARRRSGVHFHAHSILFLERKALSASEAEVFRDELAARWTAALVKVGLIRPDQVDVTRKHGADIQPPKVKIQGALYDDAKIKELVDYVCKGAAFELSPSPSTKSGRKADRMSHWELMREALVVDQGDPKLQASLQGLLVRVMRALKGRAHMYYSPGLKAFCGLRELTDGQIMDGKKAEPVYDFAGERREEWKGIRKYGQQKALLVALDQEGVQDVGAYVEVAARGFCPITGEMIPVPDMNPEHSAACPEQDHPG